MKVISAGQVGKAILEGKHVEVNEQARTVKIGRYAPHQRSSKQAIENAKRHGVK